MIKIEIKTSEVLSLCQEYLRINNIENLSIVNQGLRFKAKGLPVHVNVLSVKDGKIRLEVKQNTLLPVNGLLNNFIQNMINKNSLGFISRDKNCWDIDLNSAAKDFNLPVNLNQLNISEEKIEINFEHINLN